MDVNDPKRDLRKWRVGVWGESGQEEIIVWAHGFTVDENHQVEFHVFVEGGNYDEVAYFRQVLYVLDNEAVELK